MKKINRILSGILGLSCVAAGFAQQIRSDDLIYLGAFRLPDSPGTPDNVGWEWSNWSSALTFYPDGDADGPDDGFTGSLFGVGHDHTQYVSEISIPVPVISPNKNLNDLNTAQTLQPFQDIKGDLFGEMEMPRVGLEYIRFQNKLYFAWAQHLDEGATQPSHGYCDLTLENPNSAGLWRIGENWNYVTGDYLLSIPVTWADEFVSGMMLGTGRFRDGGQGAMGPSLFAIAPWQSGNPPEPGSTIPAIPLLLYGNVYQENSHTMQGYHHSDEWSGAVWMTAGEKSAVVFVGTKGKGNCWYGCQDGTDQPPWPEDCNRGWWSSRFIGQMLFYNPEDLAAVARGDMQSREPQPCDSLNLDSVLYHIQSDQEWHHVGAAAYDSDHHRLYVMEPLADEDKSIIHVWQIETENTEVGLFKNKAGFQLLSNFPNPFNSTTSILFYLEYPAHVHMEIFNNRGQQVKILTDQDFNLGNHCISCDLNGLPTGIYFYRIRINHQLISTQKMLLAK